MRLKFLLVFAILTIISTQVFAKEPIKLEPIESAQIQLYRVTAQTLQAEMELFMRKALNSKGIANTEDWRLKDDLSGFDCIRNCSESTDTKTE